MSGRWSSSQLENDVLEIGCANIVINLIITSEIDISMSKLPIWEKLKL